MVGTLLSTRCDAKIDWKALSKRIGHADVAFTMKQYVQTNRRLARLPRGHLRGGRPPPWRDGVRPGLVSKSVHKPHAKGPLPVRKRASGLGSGERI